MWLLLVIGCGLAPYNQDTAIGARFELSPEGEISFQKVPADKATSTEITVLSTGDERVTIETVTLTGPNADYFALPPDLPLPLGLVPGADFPITLSFEPAAEGQFSALLEVAPVGGPATTRRLVAQACAPQGGAPLCPSE